MERTIRRKNRQESSLRLNMLTAMSILIVSLLVAVILFDWYAVQEQRRTVSVSRSHTLSSYREQMENALLITSNYLTDAPVLDMDFLSLAYARTKTEAYTSSVQIASKCRALLRSQKMLGGFFTYNPEFDYCHSTYADSGSDTVACPYSDLITLRNKVISLTDSKDPATGWIPVSLSDRTVFLYACVYQRTVFAAILDPARQNFSNLEDDAYIFYTLADKIPCSPSTPFGSAPLPAGGKVKPGHGDAYDLTVLPLSQIDGFIYYAVPTVSFLGQISFSQKVLLAITFCLLGSIPLCWIALRKRLLIPLKSLTNTLHAIQTGDTNIRVPQDSNLQEANEIANTVNTMLDIMKQLKIDSYEYQLEVQHAQLQYLQLQIRPHFFLNCLNMIYSMAEEEKYAAIQELVLDLSVYLRSTFKNTTNLVPLEEEIRSTGSYIRIQQTGMDMPPILEIDMEADTVEIPVPPLSILSFVENSVKYSRLLEIPLDIRIKCRKLPGEDGDFLNITIQDNCGGIPSDTLNSLNRTMEEVYHDHNVGSSNVKQRLKLIYGDKAILSFQNRSNGACVDIFLPLNEGAEKNNV